jgi:AraC-like DNA-binding protein
MIFPSDIRVKILYSRLVEESNIERHFENSAEGEYHFFLNLGEACEAECSFSENPLVLEKYHLICWGPGDELRIKFPYRRKYIYIKFEILSNENPLPITEWWSFNRRNDPRLFLAYEDELLNEFYRLPNCRSHGRYHLDLSNIRLLKICSLLGKQFWVPLPSEAFQNAQNPTSFRTPSTESLERKKIETNRLFNIAVDYLFDNFRSCSTANLAEYMSLSQPKIISLIKGNAGKKPRELIEDIKFSIAFKKASYCAIRDVTENFDRSLKHYLIDLSETVGLPLNTLNRKFNEVTGKTATQFYEQRKKEFSSRAIT